MPKSIRPRTRLALSIVTLVPLSVGAALASCTSSDDNTTPTCTNGGVPCIDASAFDATGFDATGFDVQQLLDTSVQDAPLDTTQSNDDASETSTESGDGGTDAADAADAADANFDANGPFVVASGLTNPQKLVLAGGYLFWTDSNDNVGQVSVNGGAVIHIDAGVGAQQMTADDTNVYWSGGASNLYQLAIGTTTVTTIGHGIVFNPYLIESNGGFLYWAEYLSGGAIRRVPIGGDSDASTPVTSPTLLNPDGLAFVGSQAYVAVSDGTQGNGTISAILPDAGLQNLAAGRFGPAGLITDGARLYWVDNGGSPDEVESIGLDGGGAVVYSQNFLHPYLATDGVSLYIMDYNGAITKTPVGVAGQLSTLYNFSYDTGGLAVDATWVYWIDEADGIIYKIAK